METVTRLTQQQVRFFETFGFLTLPGLFRDEIEQITEAFEAVFATEEHLRMETYEELHGEQRRLSVASMLVLEVGGGEAVAAARTTTP